MVCDFFIPDLFLAKFKQKSIAESKKAEEEIHSIVQGAIQAIETQVNGYEAQVYDNFNQ